MRPRHPVDLPRGGAVILAALVWCGAALWPNTAAGQCTREEMYDMLDQGMTPAQIQRQCDNRRNIPRGQPQGQPQWRLAQVCVTQVGTCFMGQAVPVGAPCYCPTMYGPIPGFGR